MAAYSIFAGVAVSSAAVALGLAFRSILNPSFRYGKVDTEDRNNPLIMACRWLSGPISAVATAFCIALRPEVFQAALPSMFGRYGGQLHKVLPLHPQDILEAFQLGAAHRMLTHEGNTTAALEIAKRIAGRVVGEDELRRVPDLIAEHLNHQGVVSRVLSAFTIVNIVWFVAILGLTATVGPFVYTILKPLRGLLYELSQVVLEYTIKVAKRLSPLAESLLYTLSLYILVESSRYVHHSVDAYSMVGPMTAVTGLAVFGLSWAYTTAKNSDNSGNVELFMTLTWTLASLFCVPAAQMHQSSLLGYGAVVAAASALGFSAYSSGLCTMIGFQDKDALLRGAIGCGSMTAAAFALQAFQVNNEWTSPLIGPLSVMGTSVYLLALDIHAFMSREGRSHGFFIANLIAITAGGHFVGLTGAANVAKTFGGLLMFTVFCERPPRDKEGFTVWIFALFASLYGISLYVSRNPELIVSLMSGGRA
jgi:hypothetical protein